MKAMPIVFLVAAGAGVAYIVWRQRSGPAAGMNGGSAAPSVAVPMQTPESRGTTWTEMAQAGASNLAQSAINQLGSLFS